MAQSIGNILHTEDEAAVEKYGSLSGTDKQLEVVRVALDNPDWEPDELAAETGSSEGYLRNLLRRATPDVINAAREDNGPPDNETEERAPPEGDGDESPPPDDEGVGAEPVEAAMYDAEESEPSAVWHGGGIGKMVEVSALEWCDECQQRHRVIYLIPATEIGYLMEPDCGHGGRYRDTGEAHRDDVERVIDAVDHRQLR